MQNAKIFKGINLEQIKAEIERNCETPLAGDFAYATSNDTYYKFSNLTGKWEYLIDGLGSTIPMVSFGTSLPQTNAAAALATIVDPTKTPIVVVRDADKNEVVLHVYTPTGWVAHRDNVGTINHFDFTTFATKQDATAALPNKNPNDLMYVSGEQKLYFVNASKQLEPIDLGLGTKQEDVGFALADIDGDGNDDVFNKRGHKLMLTDSSGSVIPVTHEGQAISKKYLDSITGSLTSLLTTNKGNIVGALNELYNTGSQLNADIQSKLKHLTSAEHIIEFNTGNPTDPATVQAALATITSPAEGSKALLVDKTAGKSRLEIYHTGKWITLTDDVGGNIDLTAYQTTAQADSKYATKTVLAGKQDTLTTSQKAVVDGHWVPTGKGASGKGTWEWIYDEAHDETRLKHSSLLESGELTLGETKVIINADDSFNIGDITTTPRGIDTSVTILESNGLKKKTSVHVSDNSFEAVYDVKPYLATTDSGVVTKKLLDTTIAGIPPVDLTAYQTTTQADGKYAKKSDLIREIPVTTDMGIIDQVANLPALTSANVGKFFTYYGQDQTNPQLTGGSVYLVVDEPKLSYKEIPDTVTLTAGQPLREYNYIPTKDGEFIYKNNGASGVKFTASDHPETREGSLFLTHDSVILNAGTPRTLGHLSDNTLTMDVNGISLSLLNPNTSTHSELTFQPNATETRKLEALLKSDIIELRSGLIKATMIDNTSIVPFIATTDDGLVTKKYIDTKLFKTNDTGHIVFKDNSTSVHTLEEILKVIDTKLTSIGSLT